MAKRLALGIFLVACVGHQAFTPGIAAPAPPAEPALVLKTAHPPAEQGKAQLFIFQGTFPGSIHRSGPEHFKLTRVSDGEGVSLNVAADRETLDNAERGERVQRDRTPSAVNRLSYNYLFKGVRLSLDTGRYDAKDLKGEEGILDLYGRAKLEPGVRYRLTWACWPVGAKEAKEISCEFDTAK